ncbi:MAG: flippase-like domain-containing protein [Candidatus Aminicenantes bacterium]|nr:flippase-like domain-containing protein [Candidatus Aminicenantes bacterium]
MKSRKIIFKSAFVIGVGLFVFLIIKVGPMNILENISKLTWKSLGILFVLRLIYWVIRTYIWRRVCQCYGDSYSFSNFFAARMAGHAVSYLTPATYIGGAAFRTMSVSSLNKTKVLASVIVEKTVEIITALLLTVIGVLMAVFRISIPEGFKYISIIGILFAVLLILFVFLKQRKGLITWFVQSLQRVRIKLSFFEEKREKIRETDDYISGFYNKNKKEFLRIFIYYLFLHIYWVFEIYLTMFFLSGEKVDFISCFLIVTLGTVVFFIPNVPASLGTYEAAYVGLFVLMGFSADLGMSVTIFRRILALFWAGFGLCVIGTRRLRQYVSHS